VVVAAVVVVAAAVVAAVLLLRQPVAAADAVAPLLPQRAQRLLPRLLRFRQFLPLTLRPLRQPVAAAALAVDVVPAVDVVVAVRLVQQQVVRVAAVERQHLQAQP